MHAQHRSSRHRTRYLIVAALTLAGPSMSARFSPRVHDTPAVHALFELSAPTGSPFPTDRFTVADSDQNTGRRVALPMPSDCVANRSDCDDVAVLNELDGFNIQPRLSVPFDGDIDVRSVNSDTVFLVKLICAHDDESCDAGPAAPRIGINQVVWDAVSRMLHVESDALLDQHSRYALIVTTAVRDKYGSPVDATHAFRRFRQTVTDVYKDDILDAVHAARRAGVDEDQIAVASVFTTQSTTAVMEKIRDQIRSGTPAPAQFTIGPGDSRLVFPFGDVLSVTWTQQIRTTPSFTTVTLDLTQLQSIPGVVGYLAFGKYVSPEYRTSAGVIPPVATRTGSPAAQGASDIYFNLVLPAGTPPPGGWPVAIAGHGGDGSKGVDVLGRITAVLAQHGIATIGINIAGHGFGPLGTLTVTRGSGAPVTFSSGGRGVDRNADGVIGTREGLESAPPASVLNDTDGFRQTVADLMQLVRVLEVGVDVDGDGLPDLDPSRIYFVGQSMGAMIGTDFLALDPVVRAGTLTGVGGPRTSNALNAVGSRATIGGMLAARTPSLVNAPGVVRLDGVAVPLPPLFNENLPLRDDAPLEVGLADGTTAIIQSPVVNTVAGVTAIQEYLERVEWAGQGANPVAYAPYLRKTPLSGSGKPVIVQFAKGDRFVPNPATTALLRAGELADRATYYRHDLASLENPALPKPAHGFMVNTPAFGDIARGAQEQIAVFLASDGVVVIHPEPVRFFEVPIAGPLPETLNFVR
jgi:Bacterial virulence factor lipase N-terminal